MRKKNDNSRSMRFYKTRKNIIIFMGCTNEVVRIVYIVRRQKIRLFVEIMMKMITDQTK